MLLLLLSSQGGIYEIGCEIAVLVEGGGSELGANRLCGGGDGPVDIGLMSRNWWESEARVERNLGNFQCVNHDTSRGAIQVPIAIDGVALATANGGAAKDCIEKLGGLTKDQLRWIFSSYSVKELEATGWNPSSLPNSDGDDSTHLWSELSSSCASEEILISGADDLSVTYYYFLETVLTDHSRGETFDLSRPNGYTNSAVDEDLVTFLTENDAGIAYFGFYYFQNSNSLYAVPIENSAGQFVTPSDKSVENGTYEPLSRRMYMNLYNDPESLAATVPFVRFGMSDEGSELVEATGYVPIPPTERLDIIAKLNAAVNGKLPIGPSVSYTGGISYNDKNNDETGLGAGSIAGIILLCLFVIGVLSMVVFKKMTTGKEADTGSSNDTKKDPYGKPRTNWAVQEPEVEPPIPSTAQVV
jgi:ABC-type phosphate transport system substrate-binding protein